MVDTNQFPLPFICIDTAWPAVNPKPYRPVSHGVLPEHMMYLYPALCQFVYDIQVL